MKSFVIFNFFYFLYFFVFFFSSAYKFLNLTPPNLFAPLINYISSTLLELFILVLRFLEGDLFSGMVKSLSNVLPDSLKVLLLFKFSLISLYIFVVCLLSTISYISGVLMTY